MNGINRKVHKPISMEQKKEESKKVNKNIIDKKFIIENFEDDNTIDLKYIIENKPSKKLVYEFFKFQVDELNKQNDDFELEQKYY